MKKLLVILLAALCIMPARADEGMWLLPLIQKLNIQKMNGMGCVLTADQIYSDSATSLYNAVVMFGNGCTGIMVSNEGLVFTNHHCGFESVQQLSDVENNYLKNGYNAVNQKDELPAPGLTVSFLNRIEDVTDKVMPQLEGLTGEARLKAQDSICSMIAAAAADDAKHLKGQVKSFFANNQFYLFVYQIYRDVRFCFAPSEDIGKFGGDTDNWMWPRQTGDFSVFRVYSHKNGLPADYSPDNVPFSPKRFAKVSLEGYKDGDFTMIMGYPGNPTKRYASSWEIENRMNGQNQAMIDVRGAKQDVWMSFMSKDPAINLAYASKYAQSANYWKNSIGMNQAIKKLNVIADREERQKEFTTWVNQKPERQQKYGNVLNTLQQGYAQVAPGDRAVSFLYESLFSGVDIIRFGSAGTALKNGVPKERILKSLKSMYSDYYPQVDKATFVAMLQVYKKSVDAAYLPDFYNFIDKKFKGNFQKYADYVFDKSVFTSYEKCEAALKKPKFKIENDPAVICFNNTYEKYLEIVKNTEADSYKIEDTDRLYQAGQLEMAAEQGKAVYPDANSTMRLTYGKVGGYEPSDGVIYKYYTTTDGVLQKEKPGDYEFNVPANLKQAILNKDFGKYADKTDGTMHVCFLSNTDITGGNSGSPIFNGKGELLGLAFDGNWEAMSGDIAFDTKLNRTINVDVRYILFVMDKVNGAKRLVNELQIAK